MRPRLNTTAAVLIDLGDQPPSQYVLVIDDAPGGRQAFAVDSWIVKDGLVAGYRVGRPDLLPIMVFPERYCWQVLSRDVMEPVSLGVYLTRGLEDDKLVQELQKRVMREPDPVNPSPDPATGGIVAMQTHGPYF